MFLPREIRQEPALLDRPGKSQFYSGMMADRFLCPLNTDSY